MWILPMKYNDNKDNAQDHDVYIKQRRIILYNDNPLIIWKLKFR